MLSAAELSRMVGFWYNMRMEKIATDTYSFERIREGGEELCGPHPIFDPVAF